MKRMSRSSEVPTVNSTGARAGDILAGVGPNNQGLRLRICDAQPRGDSGPIQGPFQLLDAGDSRHSEALKSLLGGLTDAAAVLRAIRRECPSCVSVVNANLLRIERSAGDAEHDQRDTQRNEVPP